MNSNINRYQYKEKNENKLFIKNISIRLNSTIL